jgi:hypothetical protein
LGLLGVIELEFHLEVNVEALHEANDTMASWIADSGWVRWWRRR